MTFAEKPFISIIYYKAQRDTHTSHTRVQETPKPANMLLCANGGVSECGGGEGREQKPIKQRWRPSAQRNIVIYSI